MEKKSIFGLSENVASLLCYAGLFFSGIVILVMEKENKTVRFHALQSTLWFMFLGLVRMVASWFAWFPLFGGLLATALQLLFVASWIFLMYTAYTGKKFKIPMIGDTVESQIYK